MELRDVDLNLLVVFEQLLRQGTVSGAAKAMNLSQPAVSNALARLRTLLGDQLFVRSSKGMLPTPLALELAEPISFALESLQATLSQKRSFDPEHSTRAFRVAMTDIGEVHFIPPLMGALGQRAPGVTLATVRNTAVDLAADMSQGKIDLAVGHLPELGSGFFQRRLFRQRYVCLFRPGHALDKKKISMRDFEAAEHVVVTAAGTGHARVDELLAEAGVNRRVRLHVPHFVALADIIATTDLVATVTWTFAERCARYFGLKYVSHPFALPEIQINLFWHARYHHDPANQWLRNQFVELFAD
ncbi:MULTISPECIES: LysR family transcriptional regulator [Cupriavidus]|uniref:Transcriptional regulator, LysR family n=1 Tax=Cupriavidus pinatubonensis (strain JMP 134 / LMG 1197) TaxID=264198 RepID=Q46S18_CUPPJ|nr:MULTISPECIES: LysR family transcriptional regulator [Cupriavidus]TPQ28804.1 LysR family transcriptional regulator [Cupriavidus pinatubonensis]